MKVFSAFMLLMLLSGLFGVGTRVAGPIAPVRQASESSGSNGDGSKTLNSPTPPKSPPSQTYEGASNISSVSSAGNAGVMWVEPSPVSLRKDSTAVGYRFNVTVWLNMTQSIFSYQVGLLYNRTQLKCDRAGFTDDRTSIYFEGHFSSEEMAIDRSMGNGSIMAGESCVDSDCISGPHVGSLLWIEFEVLIVPRNNENIMSKFDINTSQTLVLDSNLNNVQIEVIDGDYAVLSTSDLSVSVNPAAVTMYVGQSQLFASNVTGGTPPYTFQWYNDYEAALDGTDSNWTFTPNTPGSHQVYLEVTDSSNTVVTSNFVSVEALSPDLYNVTINAHCDTEGSDISVPVMMDGSSTGLDTPQTFTSLTGTHNFTVPSLDSSGHSFRLWDQGSASTTIVLSSGGTYTAYFGGDQWSANAMWVEPSNVTLTGGSATVGYRFNVTVWLNVTQNMYAYQVGLLYNRTQLKCDRAGFTYGGTSEYFIGHYSCTEMLIDTGCQGNGSIAAGECCLGSDCIMGPRAGSLIWLEFEVVAAPQSNMSFTSKFDMNTKSEDESDTFVLDCNLNLMNLAVHNGDYEISSSDVPLGLASATMQLNAASAPIASNLLCAVLERRRQILVFEAFCTG